MDYRVKVARVVGLDVVDPLVGMVADTILFAFKETVNARIGNQANVVVVNKGKPSHEVVDPIEQRVRLHLGFALLLGHLIEYCALEMEEAELDGDVAVLLTLLFDEYFLKGSDSTLLHVH